MITLCAGLTLGTPAVEAAAGDDPSFVHGVGQVIKGVFLVLPGTVIDATLTEPPVLGTMVGVLAGVSRAIQTTCAGLAEMSAGFNPWLMSK